MTNPLDDKIEAKENAFAALDRLYDENVECLRRLAMGDNIEEPPITAEQLQELYGDVNLEQLIWDSIVNEGKEKLDRDFEKILYDNLWDLYDDSLNSIIMHPDIAKLIEDYNNQNATQKFLQKIKWGFDDCRDNFRNWRGHVKGEEWDFWEILSGEESGYE
jgi:hypothetical protein